MPNFEYSEDGARLFSVCVEVCVFTAAPLSEAAQGYTTFHQRFIERYGGRLKRWDTNAMKHMRPVSARTPEMLPYWLTDPRALGEDMIGLAMHSGTADDSVDPPAFEFFHLQLDAEQPSTGARISVPLDEVERNPDEFVELAVNAVADLPLRYGFAGYALSWRPESHRASSAAADWAVPLLKRHPGLALGDLLPYVMHARAGVLAVSWLTLLGASYVETLGGVQTLSAQLAHNYSTYDLNGGGTMIRAGSKPELGDVNRSDTLPHYRKLGTALAPVQTPDELIEKINLPVMRDEAKIQWLSRFFHD